MAANHDRSRQKSQGLDPSDLEARRSFTLDGMQGPSGPPQGRPQLSSVTATQAFLPQWRSRRLPSGGPARARWWWPDHNKRHEQIELARVTVGAVAAARHVQSRTTTSVGGRSSLLQSSASAARREPGGRATKRTTRSPLPEGTCEIAPATDRPLDDAVVAREVTPLLASGRHAGCGRPTRREAQALAELGAAEGPPRTVALKKTR
jgi:hypothetical protein